MDYYNMFEEDGKEQDETSNGFGLAGNSSVSSVTNNIQNQDSMKFEIPEQSSIIKVFGVGGGGSNAVNHMYRMGIKGVDFIVCNTDKQALDISPVPNKLVLGTTLTEGRGAGSIPEVGRNSAIENIEDIRKVLANNTKMVFITAGMGGGTGTGAAPIIAGIAREMGILTVGIVTVPFAFEGKKRKMQAEEGLDQLKQVVDTLLVICNDKLREMYGNLKLTEAFAHADNVLTTAAKSIAEIISLTQQINVDFADVCTVMRNSGVAIMGSATASGENRALRAVQEALNSPLLNDNNIVGARYVLLNIVSGASEITMDELGEITDFIQDEAGQTAEIIKGYGVEPSLGENVSVTIIATGFNSHSGVNYEFSKKQPEKVVRHLEEPKSEEVKAEKEETKSPEAEVRNELEPFLITNNEPVQQHAIEFEVTNFSSTSDTEERSELEPFLKTEEEAPVAELTQETVVAETITTEVVSETITPIINDLPETIETVTPTNIESKEETVQPVAEEIPAVVNVTPVNVTPETTVQQTTTTEPVAEKQVPSNEDELAKQLAAHEQMRKAQERIMKLKELSLKLKTPQGLNELENEPAYKRRNIQLEQVPHSSESQVSRFTLTETDDKKVEIRPNNSFLHDNVD